jgi:hypothetical protein
MGQVYVARIPMTRDETLPAGRFKVASLRRPLAILAAWTCLVVVATSVFFAPRGREVQPTADDLVGFALAVGISAAVTAAVAFGVAGRWKWSFEVAVAVVPPSLVVALLLTYFFWVDIRFARLRLSAEDFQRYQWMTRNWAVQTAGYLIPLGSAVGIVLGSLTGLLARLARRKPRMAHTIALALPFALVSEAGRHSVGGALALAGLILRYYGLPWSISSDQIASTGMFFGAMVGAVVAGLSLHVGGQREKAG